MHGRATIFMLHRLRHPELGNEGHDPEVLRKLLSYLRRDRYALLPLDEIFARLQDGGQPLRRAVAFTLDDGYVDQAAVAAPIFAEYDCPATTFVTTGFLDGEIWQWWDQIEFVLLRTKRPELTVSLGERRIHYSLGAAAERQAASDDFAERCKEVTNAEREAAIVDLSERAQVELPRAVPPAYAPMTWAQLRACEARGMAFAPHTVTHPVLARTPADRSRWEIEHAWQRLRDEARRPLPIFAYPNGRDRDFGSGEIETLRDLGFRGAVTTEYGYASADSSRRSDDARFRVPRVPFWNRLPSMIYSASGAERVVQLLMRS
jgi:peptidoglycan/xylan/chitin deacetylase (PgdA/CDA1 family)